MSIPSGHYIFSPLFTDIGFCHHFLSIVLLPPSPSFFFHHYRHTELGSVDQVGQIWFWF
ncbi:hypothetical protein LINPERPRIM_LOCUS35489 [Linum perenne]